MGNVNRFFGIVGQQVLSLMLTREADGKVVFLDPFGNAPDFDPLKAQYVGQATIVKASLGTTFRLTGGVGSAPAFLKALKSAPGWRAERGLMTLDEMAAHSAYGKGWTVAEVAKSYAK